MNVSLLWIQSVLCLMTVLLMSACAQTPKTAEHQPVQEIHLATQAPETQPHPDQQLPTDYRVVAVTSDAHKCSCQTGTEFDHRSTCLCTSMTFTLETQLHCVNTTVKPGNLVAFDKQDNTLTLSVVPEPGPNCQEPGTHTVTFKARTPSERGGKASSINPQDIRVNALPKVVEEVIHP